MPDAVLKLQRTSLSEAWQSVKKPQYMYKHWSIRKTNTLATATHLPFLYQTSTILGLCKLLNRSYKHLSCKHFSQLAHKQKTNAPAVKSENETRTEKSGTENGGKVVEKTFLSTKAESVQQEKAARTRSKQPSTITKAEKQTFSRIFHDLIRGSGESTDTGSPNQGKRKKRFADTQDASESEALSERIASIYQDAIREYGQLEKLQPGARAHALDDRLLARLPPELRKTAEKADSLYFENREVPVRRTSQTEELQHEYVRPDFIEEKKKGKSKSHKDTIPLGDLVQKIGLRELEETAFRFDQATKKADGDLEIWQICEERVFPLIQLMRPSEDQATPKKTPTRPDPSSTKPLRLELPSYVPPLTLVSRLYPASLNLAISLLANHFPTSLILPSFLPRIKSLGPISFVLGASTPLYNTLLKVQWHIYSDLRSMNDLLTEMSDSGVDFDEMTLKILRNVEIAQRRDLSIYGDKSREFSRAIAREQGLGKDRRHYSRRARSDAWWNLKSTDYWAQRICHYWIDVVDRDIKKPRGDGIEQNEENAIEPVVPERGKKIRQVQESALDKPIIADQEYEEAWLDEDEPPAAAAAG